MARIRTIKPEFFTSEVIASLPLSARLTFIGLWTYVDDNGVGLDNELLITAAIWPLERDNLETLSRTREDLARLSRDGLVKRYADSRKRYLFVASWDEHQKVDHPRKPRYPRPDDPRVAEAATSEDTPPDTALAKSSRSPRETVAPEQGTGNREQGTGNAPSRRRREGRAEAPTLPGAPPKPETPDQRANRLAKTYTDRMPLAKFQASREIVRRAIDAKLTDEVITAALATLAGRNATLTLNSLHEAIYGRGKGPPARNGHRSWQNPPDQSVYDEELAP